MKFNHSSDKLLRHVPCGIWMSQGHEIGIFSEPIHSNQIVSFPPDFGKPLTKSMLTSVEITSGIGNGESNPAGFLRSALLC